VHADDANHVAFEIAHGRLTFPEYRRPITPQDLYSEPVVTFGLDFFSLSYQIQILRHAYILLLHPQPSRAGLQRAFYSLKFSRDALANPLGLHNQPVLAKRTGTESAGLGFDFPHDLPGCFRVWQSF
jgi:hypothetical protein